MDLVPRIERDAEERIAQVAVNGLMQDTSRLADAQGAVPIGDGLEIRLHEASHVVPDSRWELVGTADHKAGAAVQSTPNAEGDREGITALDPTVARTEHSERRSRPSGKHEVAG